MTLSTMKEIIAERQRIIQAQDKAIAEIYRADFANPELRSILLAAIRRFYETPIRILDARFDVAEWYQSQ